MPRPSLRIPRELPQFRNAPTLIVVTGEQDAVLFLAQNGSITRVSAFRIEKPTFSDHEGHFQRQSRGATITSGAGQEIRHEEIRTSFLRMLREALRHVDRPTPYDAVYVFTPKQLHRMVIDVFPARLKKRLARVVLGNYVEAHPRDLLAKLVPESHVPPQTPEAAALLRIRSDGE